MFISPPTCNVVGHLKTVINLTGGCMFFGDAMRVLKLRSEAVKGGEGSVPTILHCGWHLKTVINLTGGCMFFRDAT